MGDFVKLTASDGHELEAYVANASGDVKGAIVIIQEIFGVNTHIRPYVTALLKTVTRQLPLPFSID